MILCTFTTWSDVCYFALRINYNTIWILLAINMLDKYFVAFSTKPILFSYSSRLFFCSSMVHSNFDASLTGPSWCMPTGRHELACYMSVVLRSCDWCGSKFESLILQSSWSFGSNENYLGSYYCSSIWGWQSNHVRP